MRQLVAVICSGDRSQVKIGFPNQTVDVYRLERDGSISEHDGVKGVFVFGTGVWAFMADGPVELVEASSASSVLIRDGEDPWPKPPPPPPLAMFSSFHEYSKHFDTLETKLVAKLRNIR